MQVAYMHVPNVTVSYQYTLRQTVQYGHSCCQWLRSDRAKVSTLPNRSLDLPQKRLRFSTLKQYDLQLLGISRVKSPIALWCGHAYLDKLGSKANKQTRSKTPSKFNGGRTVARLR